MWSEFRAFLLGRIDFSSLMIVLDSAKGVPASLADARDRGFRCTSSV